MINPYYPQPQQYYSPVQQLPSYTIPGRLVNNGDDIRPNEVPMDGRVGLFPQSDYSCIYAKAWTSNGTIITTKFVPEAPVVNNTSVQNNATMDQILSRLNSIEEMLNKRSYNNYKQPKKEESVNV